MTQRQSFAVLVVHALVAIAVLSAATVLCYSGKLDSSAVIALFGTAIGLLGANGQALATQAINGGPKPDYNKLAQSNPAELERVLAGQRGATPGPTPPPAAEAGANPLAEG